MFIIFMKLYVFRFIEELVELFKLFHANLYALEVFSCSILRVSKDRQVYDGVIECDPVSVLPRKENDTEEREAPEYIWKPAQPCLVALSTISSIELIGRFDASENSHPVNRALYPLNVSSLLLSGLISHL